VPEELLQPVPVKTAEEVADVRVQHPVHPALIDPGRQRVQRIMRAAARPEPVGEAREVRLEHGIQHLRQRPLDDLVLQRRDGDFILPLLQSCVGMLWVGAGQVMLAGLLA